VASTLQDALYAQLAEREHPSGADDPRAHASEAGACARRIWYRIRRVPQSNPYAITTLIAFQIGLDLHRQVQAALARAYSNVVTEAYWEQGMVSGHADAVYVDGVGIRVLAEIKTASPFAWSYMKAPKREHVLQAGVNAEGLRADMVHIIYLNIAAKAGDDPMREFSLGNNVYGTEAAMELWRLGTIAHAASKGTRVPREYEGKEIDPRDAQYPCTYCPWLDHCQSEGD
jgi:hypothetical protein